MRIINEHATDEDFGNRQFRRRIDNFLNYKNEVGEWTPSNAHLQTHGSLSRGGSLKLAGASPLTLNKANHATHIAHHSPLQVLLGDQDTREITYTFNTSENPNLYVKFTALNTNDVDGIEQLDKSIIYPNAWDGVDIQILSIPGKVKETTILHTKTPPKMEWSIEYPDSLTMDMIDSDLGWRDRQGKIIFRTPPPWGQDSSIVAPTIDGKQLLRASFKLDRDANIITLVPNPDDLKGGTLPISYDPTATIPYTAIDDTYLDLGNPTWNAGAATPFAFYSANYRQLARFDTSLIPLGTVSAGRFYVYRFSASYNGTGNVYAVKDANTWTEGTKNAALGSGSESTWYYKAIGTSTFWAGGSPSGYGCSVSGTDFDADASPPQITFSAAAYASVTMKLAWITDWQSAKRVNNGMMFTFASGQPAGFSTENATNKPYVEIDYTGFPPKLIYFKMI